MIGLDSNILVRYAAQDDVRQARMATQLIEGQLSERNPGFVSLVVLAEIVWVMASVYRADRPTIGRIVEGLLSASQLRVEQAEIAWRALRLYGSSKLDFSDALIAELSVDAGCRITKTFDSRAARHPGFELLNSSP